MKKPGSLLRSSGIVGLMTMLSRFLGLARDVTFAVVFGAGAETDAFFVAFKIPNFMRRLFAEGAFSQAFVPVLSEYRSQRSAEETRALVNAVAGTLGMVLLAVTLIGMIGSPLLTTLFAPGFRADPEKFALASDMLRLTFPYLFFVSLTAFAGGIMNSHGLFAVPAVTPVLLNVSLIGSALWLAPLLDIPVVALAWGVLIAGCSQLLFQLPFLARIHLLPRPRIDPQDEGVKRILKLMIPALFGVSVSQINLLLDTVLASFLQTGSVSWLYYSDRLAELPLGVFGIAIATVILPSLSRKHTEQSSAAFGETLDWAVRCVLLIALPAAAGLFILAEPMIITLFKHGELTDRDVYMSAASLRAYACGLLGFMLVKVLAPGYFSRQDTRTPVKIGIWAMVANMVFNLILVFPFKHVGLAMATALSAFLNAGLLWVGLYREKAYQFGSVWRRFMGQLLVANLVMVLVLLFAGFPVADWLAWDWLERCWRLGLLCGGGAVAYFAALWLVGVRIADFRMA